MSQMIETPELGRESQWSQYESEARSLPPFTASRRGHTRLFSGLRGLLTMFSQRRVQHHPCPECQHHQFEMPLDTLARQQPYLYINAMSN